MNGVKKLQTKNMINYQNNYLNHKGETKMTIAEVGKKYDITPDTLRYYERERKDFTEELQKNN